MLNGTSGGASGRLTATVRVHGALEDFLPRPRRGQPIAYAFVGTPSVKDALEAIGVPHPEIDRIEADGDPVGFDWRLGGHVRIEAWPVPDGVVPAGGGGLVPASPRPPRFVLDGHLGRLARYLRMLGFDTLYGTAADDGDLARRSAGDGRILLTRDRWLLRRSLVRLGYCVRSDEPRHQLDEIVRRYALASQAEPFSRCIRCDGRIDQVDREEVEDRLLPKTRRYYDEFGRCRSCGAIYWQGSHYARMRHLVDDLLGVDRAPSAGRARADPGIAHVASRVEPIDRADGRTEGCTGPVRDADRRGRQPRGPASSAAMPSGTNRRPASNRSSSDPDTRTDASAARLGKRTGGSDATTSR